MARLDSVARRIRSKNAGPFWITLDIFCGDKVAFDRICRALTLELSAKVLGLDKRRIKRFEITDLFVLKVSFPRTHVQGSRFDRDMHGAQAALLFANLEI